MRTAGLDPLPSERIEKRSRSVARREHVRGGARVSSRPAFGFSLFERKRSEPVSPWGKAPENRAPESRKYSFPIDQTDKYFSDESN